MGRPRLLLHAGLHKTGTTAIQRFASANRRILRERGLLYPTFQPIREEQCEAHNRLAHSFASVGKSRTFSDEHIARLCGYWCDHAGRDTVFLSAEAFCRHVLLATGAEWIE